jgi:hypothetical protein
MQSLGRRKGRSGHRARGRKKVREGAGLAAALLPMAQPFNEAMAYHGLKFPPSVCNYGGRERSHRYTTSLSVAQSHEGNTLGLYFHIDMQSQKEEGKEWPGQVKTP